MVPLCKAVTVTPSCCVTYHQGTFRAWDTGDSLTVGGQRPNHPLFHLSDPSKFTAFLPSLLPFEADLLESGLESEDSSGWNPLDLSFFGVASPVNLPNTPGDGKG